MLGVDSVDMLMLRDSLSCDVTAAQWAVLEPRRRRPAERARSASSTSARAASSACSAQPTRSLPSTISSSMLAWDPIPRACGRSASRRAFAPSPTVRSASPARRTSCSRARCSSGSVRRTEASCRRRWRYGTALQGGAAVSIRPTADFGLGAERVRRGVGRLRRRPRAPRRRARLGADTCRDGRARRVDVARLEPHLHSRRRGAPTPSLQESRSVPAEP